MKEALKETAIVAVAIELAKKELAYKSNKNKPLSESVKEHLSKMIDKIDPMKLVAVIGVTYLIKQGIDWAEIGVAGAVGETVENIPTIAKIFDPLGWYADILNALT